MTYYTWDQVSVCIATINQLTAWRNADVKLANAECIATDTFRSCFLTLPTMQTQRRGTNNFIKARDDVKRKIGRFIGNFRLQTAQFIYWIMQACSTTENTPAGYNTHAITLNASVTPLNFGMHFQHEHGSVPIRWDALGILPRELRITCSEQQRTAMQTLMIDYVYKADSDDITKTARAEGTTGSIVKNWGHAVDGGLGGSQTAFTYNSNAVEVDIVGIDISLRRNNEMFAEDSNGYNTIGEVYHFDYSITLDVIPDSDGGGDDIWAIMKLDKGSYAGDLDLDFKFQADATNVYIQFAFDKLYMVPIDKEASYDKATDTYKITLEPLSDASSLTVTGIDSLDDDNYENP